MIPFKIKNLTKFNKNILKDKNVLEKLNKMQDSLFKKGRLVVRPSGTESLIRIMVESSNPKLIDKCISEITKLLNKPNE